MSRSTQFGTSEFTHWSTCVVCGDMAVDCDPQEWVPTSVKKGKPELHREGAFFHHLRLLHDSDYPPKR